MAKKDPIQGDLQEQLMRIMWRLGEGSVEDVRQALPSRSPRAYTTVQTVLNRLAERGLLRRRRAANVIVYRPRVSEADYVSSTVNRTLSSASEEARRTALANLVGDLDPSELGEIQELAAEINRKRQG